MKRRGVPLDIMRVSKVGVFPNISVWTVVTILCSIIPRSDFRAFPFGTMVRMVFFFYSNIKFLHLSARDRGKVFFVIYIVVVLGVFPSYNNRGEKLALPSCADSVLSIRQQEISRNTIVLSIKFPLLFQIR